MAGLTSAEISVGQAVSAGAAAIVTAAVTRSASAGSCWAAGTALALVVRVEGGISTRQRSISLRWH